MKFVIGDIHGEVTKLSRLIQNLGKYPIEKLIFIGDYIDKGENSRETLLYLEELRGRYDCTFLIGNHEYAWLEFIRDGSCREYLLKYGALRTLEDFGIHEMDPAIIREKLYMPFKLFFESLKNFVYEKGFFISHSGLPVNRGEARVSDALDTKEYVFNRYEFLAYDKPVQNRVSIFGHTAFSYPYYDGNKIGIDTGAAYLEDAPLTAFELDSEFFLDHLNNRTELNKLNINVCPLIIRV